MIGIYIKAFRVFLSIIFKLLKMGYYLQIIRIVITLRKNLSVVHAAGKERKLQEIGL